MMDLLGAGNPYMARRFAEGGEVDPFLQTPGYISLSEQLAGVKSETQREREEYGKKMQALEDQWRSLAGLSEAPESVRNPIVEQLRSEYEASIAPARERSTEMARYYGDLANRITNYLETARPGQTLELPRNTFSRRGGSQPYNFVLDDPNNPFTYEQRKAYTDQGYSVVGRDFISDYLQNQILPKQQQAQESIDYYADPNAYMRGREKDYEERLAQALGEYRTAEQRKVEAQQQALKDYIIPLVDKAYQTEEGLQGQIAALRRSFVPMDKAQGTLLMPTEPLTPAPVQQAPVTAAPVPAPAPSIPVPSLPTNVPVPVSNLSPVPAPGIGQRVPSVIPQPGIGALPAYQTPTAQAQQPQQPQQIQYGPIGQASTSSADLLKNLLAATQQSSPYDFTKNNPYLMQNQPVQFFAEGGEVEQIDPREYAWRRLIQDSWTKEQEQFQKQKAGYEALLAQKNAEAAQLARTTAQQRLQAAEAQARNVFAPEVAQHKRDIENLNRLIRGEIDSAVVGGRYMGRELYRLEDLQSGAQTPEAIREYAIKPKQTLLDRLTNPNVIKNYALGLLVEEGDLGDILSRNYVAAIQTAVPGAKGAVGSTDWAERNADQLKATEDAFINTLAEKYRVEFEDSLARPVYNQMLQAEDNWSARVNQLYGGYETTTKQVVEDLYRYHRLRGQEVDKEVAALKALGAYTPEQVQLLRDAYAAEERYLFGPEYTYTPEGMARSRQIYNEAIQAGIRNRPTLIPSTPATPTEPTQPETAAPTVPGVPPPTSVPIPVLGQQPSVPGVPSPAPQVPVSNLTPRPMPGITAPPSIGGIPQPGMGIFASQQNPLYQSTLPTYQTPQMQQPQGQQSQQQPQQQIQYGPIGQGAVGQTNLLNTLLANQQDPTKVSLLGFDNPYLMKPFG